MKEAGLTSGAGSSEKFQVEHVFLLKMDENLKLIGDTGTENAEISTEITENLDFETENVEKSTENVIKNPDNFPEDFLTLALPSCCT